MKKKYMWWAVIALGAYYFYVNMFPVRGEREVI